MILHSDRINVHQASSWNIITMDVLGSFDGYLIFEHLVETDSLNKRNFGLANQATTHCGCRTSDNERLADIISLKTTLNSCSLNLFFASSASLE